MLVGCGKFLVLGMVDGAGREEWNRKGSDNVQTGGKLPAERGRGGGGGGGFSIPTAIVQFSRAIIGIHSKVVLSIRIP